MKAVWLGQAGYRITTENGTVILIDPYLSDTLREERGESYKREVPIKEEYLATPPDILVLTHCHADHKDYGTLDRLLTGAPVQVLVPLNTFHDLRGRYGEIHNYIMFEQGIEATINGVRLCATYAAHTDEHAIGVDIYADGKVLCHTGDTLYHPRLKTDHVHGADALILPVNGLGCNMNAVDAARLTKELAPKRTYPMHWDMFKAYGSDVNEYTKLFEDDGATQVVVPTHYEEFDI